MLYNTGKRMRFRRLIDQDTGALMIVPMDHGYTYGPIKGLKNMPFVVDQVCQGGASAVLVHKGLVRSLTNVIPPQTGLMVHVSGSTTLSPNTNYKILTGTVSEVLTLGADAISCHVNIGNEDDVNMLEDLSKLSEESNDFGTPLLSMTYVRDSKGVTDRSVEGLAHAARVTEELGADIVKIYPTVDGIDFDEVLQGINIPVVIAGGNYNEDIGEFLKTIKRCIEAGASGVSIGRNIFQSKDPQNAMRMIKEAIKETIEDVGRIEILS